MPPESKKLLEMQLKAKWTKIDHALVKDLTRAWTDVHKQVFTDRFQPLLGYRTIRWS